MLERLLQEIKTGGTLEVHSLAKKIGTTPAMVIGMLEILRKGGYIRPYQSCQDACEGCGSKSVCQASHKHINIWQG